MALLHYAAFAQSLLASLADFPAASSTEPWLMIVSESQHADFNAHQTSPKKYYFW